MAKLLRFPFQYSPKYVDMFSCNPAAYEQHHERFSELTTRSILNTGCSVQSFQCTTPNRSNSIGFPRPQGFVSRKMSRKGTINLAISSLC